MHVHFYTRSTIKQLYKLKIERKINNWKKLFNFSGKPDPPFNCTVQNITSESLEVECVEGFDNGNVT